jgi:chloramphenicol-sensitive protein RarD
MGSEGREAEGIDKAGVLFGLGAYLLWGVFPIYWRLLSAVPSFQILAHRLVWSFILTLSLSMVLGRKKQVIALFHDRKRLVATLAAGAIVTANWGIFIWAVNSGRVIETSLGYFLNPLVSVALGALYSRKNLTKAFWQRAASPSSA